MICAYKEESTNLTMSLEGKGSNEIFKSKICGHQEDARKKLFGISACRRGIFSTSYFENALKVSVSEQSSLSDHRKQRIT
jgi:hypothetical protein